jgi:hypothetical protein
MAGDIILRQDEQLPLDTRLKWQDMGDGTHAELVSLALGGGSGDIDLEQGDQLPLDTQIKFVEQPDGTHAEQFSITEENLRSLMDSLSAYASIYVDDGSTIQSGLSGTPVVVTGFTDNGLSNNMTPDVANNRIVCQIPGVYLPLLSISFSGSANTVFEMHLYVNGGEQSMGLHRAMSGGDVGAAPAHQFVRLSAGDICEIRVNVASGPGNSILPVDMQFSLFRIG